MPFVRISLLQGQTPAYLKQVSDSIQAALVDSIGINPSDRLQIIEELTPEQLRISKELVGVNHQNPVILLTILLKTGRTLEMKKKLYQQIVTHLKHNVGIDSADVIIVLNELPAENWSFGHGLATLVD